MPDGEKLAAIREALPAVGAGIYLDTASAGPLPAETAAAMAEIAEWELRTGRAGRDRRADVQSRLEEARAAVAAVLAVDLERVVLAHGVEDAAARAAAALGEPATVAGDGVAHLIDPETGRRSTTSARTLDVSLAAGAVPLDIATLDADLVVLRADAWLLGPQGIAAVVLAGAAAPRVSEPAPETFHLPSVVGLARSSGWLSMYVGLPWAHGRVRALTAHAVDALTAIAGIDVLTPVDPADRASTVAFRIRGWSADEALDELGARAFLIATTVPAHDAVRLSIGCWNTAAEIDRVADIARLLATHEPGAMPPRRTLTILGQGG
jgi:selenocysteine lyase/cysteine desulfurase